MRRIYLITATTILLLLSQCLFGQGFIKELSTNFPEIGLPNNIEPVNIERTKDNGYIIQGRARLQNSFRNGMFIIKIDENGNELWRRSYFTANGDSIITNSELQIAEDNSIYLRFQDYNSSDCLFKLSETGDSLWIVKTGYYYPSTEYSPFILNKSGGLTAFHKKSYAAYTPDTVNMTRIDENGQIIFQRKFFLNDNPFQSYDSLPKNEFNRNYYSLYSRHVIADEDSGFIAINHYFGKFDAEGNPLILDTTDYPYQGYKNYHTVSRLKDGNILYVGGNNPNGVHEFLCKINGSTGDTIWLKKYINLMFTDSRSDRSRFIEHTNGDLYFILMRSSMIRFFKFDSLGNILVEKYNTVFSPLSYRNIGDYELTSDGGVLIPATTGPTRNSDDKLFIIKMDKNGIIFTNLLVGNVFIDNNTNCVSDSNEILLNGTIIQANSNIHTFYTTSDDDGKYLIELDTGLYTIKAVPPSSYFELPNCFQQSSTISIDTFWTRDTLNIPIDDVFNCPYLTIDVSTPRVRRCINTTYTIQYCNQGTVAADSVYIEVNFPWFVDVITSSVPFTSQNNNTVRFDIGSVNLISCDYFNINVIFDFDCINTILGQTVCVEARIFPDTICFPTPTWDGSDLRTEGECIPDSAIVLLRVVNQGSGGMSGPTPIRIIEDNVMLATFNPTLLPGQIFEDRRPANGKTYTIIAAQLPGHPWKGNSVASVEACGDDGAGNISLGQVTAFNQEPTKPFISRDCQGIRGSFDPNDKTPMPKGIGVEGYISDSDEMEYLIRFQNTGTDTAFGVVIKDTLSAYLDMTTIVPGASSHPYQFNMYGSNGLKWTFDPIALPDSNVNEPASHGFVKFKVKQQPNNPDGTEITNRAAIYFDYNVPVITNTTLNTIGDLNKVLITIDEPYLSAHNIKVYPNPFNTETTIEMGEVYKRLEIKVYDLQGKLIKTIIEEQTNAAKLSSSLLNKGIYLIEVTGNNKIIGSGKIICY